MGVTRPSLVWVGVDVELDVSQAPLIHVETPMRGRIHIWRANQPPKNARAIQNSDMRLAPGGVESEEDMNDSIGFQWGASRTVPDLPVSSTRARTMPMATPF